MCIQELVSDDQSACECRVCGPCCTFSWFLKVGLILNKKGALKASVKITQNGLLQIRSTKKFKQPCSWTSVFWKNILSVFLGKKCVGTVCDWDM
jgi:hypothetical protein